MSLLRHTGISLRDFRELASHEEVPDRTDGEDFNFDESMRPFQVPISKNEILVICYVAGYVAHSMCKKLSCADCKTLFVSDRNLPDIESESHDETAFISLLSRGGLKSPSDTLFLFCKCVYAVFMSVQSSPQWFDFIRLNNPSHSLTAFSLRCLRNSPFSFLLELECRSGHLFTDYLPRCGNSFFNALCKKYVNSLSKRKPDADVSKLRKLRSSK